MDKLTIPMRPFIPTIQTLQLVFEFPSSIPPQEITCATQASTRMWSTNQITQLLHLRGNITLVFWFSDRQERWSGIDRFVYLINVTADQPLSENSIARGGVGGWLIVIRYSNTCSKSSRTISLNSEGMLCGTDNFYFIFITFSFKLELVLIRIIK